ncbi:MAG: aldose 1-epimerase family protein [Christiangramia sp.]
MNIYQLENEFLKIAVKETGAELCSVYNREHQLEHIWQADPQIWGSHAPNLFPNIGMMKNGKYHFQGKTYEMPKHGFIRHNENIRLKERSEHQLVFELLYSEKTLAVYPFKFSYRIAYTLRGKSLEVSQQVINLDTQELYFCLGGHPAFNICLFEGEMLEDYRLEFDRKMMLQSHILSPNGLVSEETKTILKNEKQIALTRDIFAEDALIFREIPSKKVSIFSSQHGKILEMTYRDFKNLGIWAKPGAPYVCLEPWLGVADFENTSQQLTEKVDIEKLEAGLEADFSYQVIFF